MASMIDTVELILQWLAALSGAGTLTYAVLNMLKAQRRPSGVLTGAVNKVLKSSYLIIATLLFVALGFILWRPLPIQLPFWLRVACMAGGGTVYFASLLLYIWGLRTLGANFNAASGFGVRLHQAHQLITHGPYGMIRHPMYLAVILAFWGGLLLYRNWTMLVFAVIMLGLLYRAAKEDEALSQAFGNEWRIYKGRVPGWIIRKRKPR